MNNKKSVFLASLEKRRQQLSKKLYKVYKDGNHYVGTLCTTGFYKKHSYKAISEEQKYFDIHYKLALQQGMKSTKLHTFLREEMESKYPKLKEDKEFINKNVKRNWHNYYSRLKRFKRKADLNLWNKFVTITYDDKKMNEQTFRKKLRKCLSNFHTRRNWRYMGVFEYGEDNKRLHFHALMYIPDDEMVGEIIEKKDYSTKQKCIQTTQSNTFFAETFGRNDFEELNQNEISNGKAVQYITKYIHKSGEKIIYSRGICSEFYKEIIDEDIATEMLDYCPKYIFFDDSIDLIDDVYKFKRKQVDAFNFLLNCT